MSTPPSGHSGYQLCDSREFFIAFNYTASIIVYILIFVNRYIPPGLRFIKVGNKLKGVLYNDSHYTITGELPWIF